MTFTIEPSFDRTHKLRDVYVVVLFIDENDGGAYRQSIVGVFAEEDFANEEKSRLLGVLGTTKRRLHDVYISAFEGLWNRRKAGEDVSKADWTEAEAVWRLARKEILAEFPDGWEQVEIVDVVKSYLVEKAIYSRTVPLTDETDANL